MLSTSMPCSASSGASSRSVWFASPGVNWICGARVVVPGYADAGRPWAHPGSGATARRQRPPAGVLIVVAGVGRQPHADLTSLTLVRISGSEDEGDGVA